MQKSKAKIIGIIPARYASTRFPGKILAPIAGKTLIQRTYENAKKFTFLDDLVIATDDQRIYDHITGFHGDVVMTSLHCKTGTDRLVDALKRNTRFDDAEIIINIQGDEPCLDPDVAEQVGKLLLDDPSAVMSTAAVKLDSEEDAASSSIVKCVMDLNSNALYFSRSLIPGGHSLRWNPNMLVYRHMGLYAYRRDFLMKYAELPETPLQMAENLEQLKVIEHGYRIKVAVVDRFSIGVDIPDDIQKVEKWLCKQNISL